MVQFLSYEEFDSWFVPKVLESLARIRGIMSCGLLRAFKITFSNIWVFSCAVVHAQVILLISPDTLFLKFCSSCVSMLKCCTITVDWSWRCIFLLWGELAVFWVTNGIPLYKACLWVLPTGSSWVCKNFNLVIVVNALIFGSSACSTGTM